MNVNISKRIETLLDTLKNSIYTENIILDDILYTELNYYERTKCLDENLSYKEFDVTTTFGEKDQHYCFKTMVEIPTQYLGEKVVLHLKTGAVDIWNTDNPQFILYVNKKMVCAFDMNHYEYILTESASENSYEIVLYSYTNTKHKDVKLELSLAVLQQEVQELYYDLFVPFQTAVLLKEDDIHRIEIFNEVNAALNQVDFRCIGSKEYYDSVQEAKEHFRKRFYIQRIKENDPTVYCVGHTHIDVAWKWRIRQTREKVLRSFLTVLYLMDKYPNYKFMSSQPQLYEFVKEDAPEIYAKIKEKVKEGRWEVEGGMWLEADCNLTSGESLIRQIIYGKRFFKEEFGKDNVILWLPDVFGYSAALPQILKKTGIKYFMTTKIGWNEYNKIPNDVFLWEGIDGSKVLTYFITTRNYEKDPELIKHPDINTTYNGRQNPSQIMGTWQRFQNKDISKNVLTCYGYGDGGGGPTAEMLEMTERMSQGIPGCHSIQNAFARDFFEKLESNLEDQQVPNWSGDLYLEFHRGTYTSMGRNKKNNRKLEFELLKSEFFQSLAALKDTAHVYNTASLKQGWKLLLLNQFHDILPGSSIQEVYEDSDIDYEKLNTICRNLQQEAREVLELFGNNEGEQGERAIYLWNTLSFERNELIHLPENICSVRHQNTYLPLQRCEGNAYCFVEHIPPQGYTILYVSEEQTQIDSVTGVQMEIEKRVVETNYYKVEFNEIGEITTLYDKEKKRQVFKNGTSSNHLVVYEDRPNEYDAWNIDSYYKEKSYVVSELMEWTVTQGTLFTTVHMKKKFMNSIIDQDIVFYEQSRRIDFETEVDWKQEQLLLKAEFFMDVLTHQATCEIQNGHIVRNTHNNTTWEQAQFEICAHKWVDVAENGYGVALLNDCKYGHSIEGADIGITLLKSGTFPYPDADKEKHAFCYSLLPHEGDFRDGKVVQQGYQLNVPCVVSKIREVSPNKKDFSVFGKIEDHVIIETIKQAEESKNIIIRLYEAYGKRGNVELDISKWNANKAWICDLMEEVETDLFIEKGCIHFEIKPYEIITLQIEKGE